MNIIIIVTIIILIISSNSESLLTELNTIVSTGVW